MSDPKIDHLIDQTQNLVLMTVENNRLIKELISNSKSNFDAIIVEYKNGKAYSAQMDKYIAFLISMFFGANLFCVCASSVTSILLSFKFIDGSVFLMVMLVIGVFWVATNGFCLYKYSENSPKHE